MNDKRLSKKMVRGLRLLCLLFSVLLLLADPQSARAQAPPNEILNTNEAKRNREMGLAMLQEIKTLIKEHYYDPRYRGIDLDVRFKAAADRIKTLNFNWQVFRVLAQVLLDFNDSHTRLMLPPRTDYFEYGFTAQMIGDKCFVTDVKKGSDAEKKGLKAGDQILNFGKFPPSRAHLWKILYVLYRLDPVNTVDLKTRNTEGAEAQFTVMAKTMTQKEKDEERKKRKDREKAKPFKCQEISKELIACKLYSFMVDKGEIDKMMKQAGQYSKLILDLRGNGGGYVVVEEHLAGYLFDHDVKIADVVTRKKNEVRMAKTKRDKSYKGELVVLVDSHSASAAEMVARVVQIEKRGKVVGDLSSGAVMTSVRAPLFGRINTTAEAVITYTGMSLTIADVIMSDGSRIEGVGVRPDVSAVPTPLALAQRTDPVLAHAATMLGASLTPEKAGEFYFIGEKPEGDEDADTDGDN